MFLGLHFSNRTTGTIVIASATIFIERKIELSRRNSENIPLFIRDLLKSIGQSIVDLSCIGVVVGPGALTPLRLSVATAQTLGVIVGVPVIELSAFEVNVMDEWMTTQLVVLEGRGKQCLVRGFSCTPDKKNPLFDYIEKDISEVIRLIRRFNAPIGVVTNTELIADQLRQECPSVSIRHRTDTGGAMIRLIERYQGSIAPRAGVAVEYAYSPV